MNFDLHVHASLKSMFTGINNMQRKSCWTKLNTNLSIASSQSCLRQITNGDGHIVIGSLYSLEHGIASVGLLKKELIVKLLTKNKLCVDFIKAVSSHKITPIRLLYDEIALLENAQRDGEFEIVEAPKDIRKGRINMVLSIEGAQTLQNAYRGGGLSDKGIGNSILHNLDAIRSAYRILYIAPAHLTQNLVSTHAYGMKLLKNEKFRPTGKGLKPLGKRLIEQCSKAEGMGKKPVLIDVKHMSAIARMQLYAHRKAKNINQPLIASHVAVNGFSYERMYVSKTKGYKDDWIKVKYHSSYSPIEYLNYHDELHSVEFNSWSINLYNEDIIEIIKSKGLIGLILDSRVLGVKDEAPEIFSKPEFNDHKNNGRIIQAAPNNVPPVEPIITDSPNIGVMHLFANIMHIVMTCHKHNLQNEVWDHICIGTDFDGLISPIKELGGEGVYNKLNFGDINIVKRSLQGIIRKAKNNKDLKEYFGQQSPKVIVDKIFFRNGTRFVRNHL